MLPLLGFFLDDNGHFPHLVSEWMLKGTLFDYLKILEHGEEIIRMVRSFLSFCEPLEFFELTRFFKISLLLARRKASQQDFLTSTIGVSFMLI